MTPRFPPGGLPTAWYVVSPSADLAPAQVKTVPFCGRELVVYRTEAGVARAVEPVCPHLGAHLGGGLVRGENLVCAMHGFEYGLDGKCVKLAYGTRPPPRASLAGPLVQERNGWVMVWYSADGAAPTWEVDEIDTLGWTPVRHQVLEIAGHPQETTENSVDLGHFQLVHQYDSAEVAVEPRAEGATLSASYRVVRSLGWLGVPQVNITACFDVRAHGLGYSAVHVRVPKTPIHARLFVHATPISSEKIHLHLGASVRQLPVPGASAAYREAAFRGLFNDVQQDIPFWEKKQYLDQPALAEGDGPIPVYRRWCKQFYPSARRLETVA